MTVRDISIALATSTPPWPGDTPFGCGWTSRIGEGASVNLSAMTSSPHVGTHADAPLHVHDDWPSADAMPLEPFAGRASVCTVHATAGARSVEALELDAFPTLPAGRVERLLVRTGHSVADGAFPDAWPALSEEAIEMLLDRGLRLLGVDAPSVDPRASTALRVHRLLFAREAYVLENLDLRGVSDGIYDLVAYPVKIAGLDAAPVRAVLRSVSS